LLGIWSGLQKRFYPDGLVEGRRISDEHRIVYKVESDSPPITQLGRHY
jgi:Txe/YoeB family toxin of Txe-Axe toxin-antitoxin module